MTRHILQGPEIEVDYVLVHGTTQSSAGFDRLASSLARRGHRVAAVDLPADQPEWLAEDYAEFLAAQLDLSSRPIVAAHSGSGILLPAIARKLDAVRMVWLAAYVPRPGVSLLDEIRNSTAMFNPEWVGQDPTTDDVVAAHFLFHDCDLDALRWALRTLRPFFPSAAYAEVFPQNAYPDVPSTYVVCRRDRTVDPEWQHQAATERLGADIVEMDAGHAPYVCRPADLAEVLEPSA